MQTSEHTYPNPVPSNPCGRFEALPPTLRPPTVGGTTKELRSHGGFCVFGGLVSWKQDPQQNRSDHAGCPKHTYRTCQQGVRHT